VGQGLGVQRPLVVERPQHAQRLAEHAAYAPQEQRLVGVERVTGAGHEQRCRAIDRNSDDGAVAEAVHLEDGQRADHGAAASVRAAAGGICG
jgi:hypothetical protein